MYNRMVCLVCVCVCWLGGGLKSGPGCKTAWKSLSFCVFAAPAVLSDICFVGGKHKRQQKKKSKNKNWLFFFVIKKADGLEKWNLHQKWKCFGKQTLSLHLSFLTSFVSPQLLVVCFVVFVLLIFVTFDTIPSSSKVNFHIPHGCDLRCNETEQSSNVKIDCVRSPKR